MYVIPDKLCKRCNLVKPGPSFRLDSRYKDGYNSWCKDCCKEYQKGRKTKKQRRHNGLWSRYRITPAEVEDMLRRQGGVCDVCKNLTVRPCVDHNEKTMQIRGILCPDCNVGIGQFQEDLTIFDSAVQYLQKERPLPTQLQIMFMGMTNQDWGKDTNLETYGLSREDYEQMLKAQNGVCAICYKTMRLPHVDHCHDTLTIRGLLCDQCNIGVGLFKDSPERILKAKDYLLRNPPKFDHYQLLLRALERSKR